MNHRLGLRSSDGLKWRVFEIGIVPAPGAGKTHAPKAVTRERRGVFGKLLVAQVENNIHIIVYAAVFPAMVGEDFIIVILLDDGNVTTLKPRSIVVDIFTQGNQVLMCKNNTFKLLGIAPVQPLPIGETTSLEELLPL